MRRTASLAQKLSTVYPRSNGLPHHLGGAFRALDNAPERSIYVKIHPRPRSLGESQQILHELKQFGEIEVYRHLKYDFEAPAPNSLFVVYKDKTAASRARERNKIVFRYADPSTAAQSQGNIPSAGAGAGLENTLEEMQPDSHNDPCSRPGELIIRAGTLQHLSHIQRQFYYWPVETTGSVSPGISMFGAIPPGMHGLRDFDVTRRKAGVRKRDGMSYTWDQKTQEKGWETLDQLWKIGIEERAAKTGATEEPQSQEEHPRSLAQ